MKKIIVIWGLMLLSVHIAVKANSNDKKMQFIDEMVVLGFERAQLHQILAQAKVKQSILQAIARPAEKSKPWHQYRDIFITDKRIQQGIEFWRQYHHVLANVAQQYGVPAEIIIAILGVETSYGDNVGHYRVLDALSTLAFHYPPRSAFFTKELKAFLTLSEQENQAYDRAVGSYAGAMGLPQFMPSSFLAYAVDYDGDGRRDIWQNEADAIASIANYLQRHGWVAEGDIAIRLAPQSHIDASLLDKGIKPSLTQQQLSAGGVTIPQPLTAEKVALIDLTGEKEVEYWITYPNFYAITRYNHSRLYAMAVLQLAEHIKRGYQK